MDTIIKGRGCYIDQKKKKQSPASLFGVNIGFIHHVRCTHSVTPPWPYTYIYIINNNNSNNGHLKCVLLRPPLLAWLHDRADSIFPSFLHSKFLIQKKHYKLYNQHLIWQFEPYYTFSAYCIAKTGVDNDKEWPNNSPPQLWCWKVVAPHFR